MAVKLQRPILVGGLGLSFSLWLLDSLQDTVFQFGEYSLLSLLAIGGGLLFLKQNRNKEIAKTQDVIPTNRSTVEKAITQTETVINHFANVAENHPDIPTLRQKAERLYDELDRKEINLAVTGGKSVGKTTLIETLKSWREIPIAVSIVETSPLFLETGNDETAISVAAASDYILFLTSGDLTDTEFQTLQQIKTENQRLMLVFNKQDQYLPDERALVLQSLKQRVQNTVATSTAPQSIKVRKHSEDGSTEEWMEQPAADIQQLTQQLGELFVEQSEQFVWASTMRQARLLKAEAKDLLNATRKEKAVPTIEQYQWIAAAAAFANPVPVLDVLGTAAINAQMVVDLGNIYQQKFSLEQAKAVAGEMGGLMLKLGLVEISSKAIGTILKSHAITFVAGGMVQGVSAAYLTRLAGLSLVEYFQEQEVTVNSGNSLNVEKLGKALQKVFQQNQQVAFLQGFVNQSVKRLLPEAQQGTVSLSE